MLKVVTENLEQSGLFSSVIFLKPNRTYPYLEPQNLNLGIHCISLTLNLCGKKQKTTERTVAGFSNHLLKHFQPYNKQTIGEEKSGRIK